MAFTHGRFTVILLNAVDLSAFVKTSDLKRTADSHDTTTYGAASHRYDGGLLDGKATMEGVYDNGTSGPHDVITPLIGTRVTLVRRPEGTGTGKPQETVTVLVTDYTETAPVADMVAWSCEMQLAGDVVEVNQ